MQAKILGTSEALTLIHKLMDGQEWNADTLANISVIMGKAGFALRDPNAPDPQPKQWRVSGNVEFMIEALNADDANTFAYDWLSDLLFSSQQPIWLRQVSLDPVHNAEPYEENE